MRTLRMAPAATVIAVVVVAGGPVLAEGSTPENTDDISSEGRIAVYGTLDCGVDLAYVRAEGDGQVYDGTIYCSHASSDPSMAGSEEGDLSLTLYPVTPGDIAKWTSDTTLTTELGTWRGPGFGSDFWDEHGGLFTNGYIRFVGEGGHEGLVYHLFLSKSPGLSSGEYLASGWIEPAA